MLIVDDSPFQIALLRDILTESGFDVVGHASSLEEVREEVSRVKPDLVTMDMTIPGTDGFECTRAVHLTANVAMNFSKDNINVDISTPTLIEGEFMASSNSDKVLCVEMGVDGMIIEVNISLEKNTM